jgi:hypothetical protein
MQEGEYRDRIQHEIASAVLGYLDDHPRLISTEVENVIPFETAAETRKAVLMSLQKQGLIRLVGSRRDAYYQRVYRRKCAITINNQTLTLFMQLYGYSTTRRILHKIDPAVFPETGDVEKVGLPFS